MPTSFNIFFQSGLSTREARYSKGDNVSLLEISNSDDSYYQTGVITVFDTPSGLQNIGDSVMVKINDLLQFRGSISVRNQHIDQGKKYQTYQLIGKTYDLWRYNTGTTITFTNQTTAYIASSLVGTYCSNLSGNTNPEDGTTITDDISFNYETIGDALARLTKIDGYKFYIDNSNQLQYYDPLVPQSARFTVTEADLISINPVEEDDADIVNDILVLGTSDYSVKTTSSDADPYKAPVSSHAVPDGMRIAQKFKANDDRLSSVKLYLNRTRDPNQPSSLDFEIWRNSERLVFVDQFSDYTYLNSGVNSYNMQVSGGYLCLAYEGGSYKTTGQIESYCYSGQFTSEVDGYDCQYIKLNMQDVTSSNRIYISGTNASGSYWSGMTNNEWLNLGYEDYAVKVRYKFSSNGDYTPKIGTATLNISDSTGGVDEELFNDSFANNDILSGGSNSYTDIDDLIYDGALSCSGNTGITRWIYGDIVRENDSDTWQNSGNILQEDGYSDPQSPGVTTTWWFEIEFNEPKTIDAYSIKCDCAGALNDTVQIRNVYISGLWSNGYDTLKEGSGYYKYPIEDGGQVTYTLNMHDNNYSESWAYSGVKKMKFDWYRTFECTKLRLSYIRFRERPFLLYSSNIKTSTQTVGSNTDMEYLKVDPSDVIYPGYITYSGSLDNGANWTKLTPGTFTTVDPGKQAILWYRLYPSGTWPAGKYSSNGMKPSSPRIGSCKLTASLVQEGGTPKSGTKMEWSDDISWSTGDVIYPPSWSAWRSYTSPKFALTENEYYWMVFSHASGSNAYWSYYNDPDSTYEDGNIAYSWDLGVNWSSNSSDPTHVPGGDMLFQLGWKQGQITATSSSAWSITQYGRHFKKISDADLLSETQAMLRASKEIESYSSLRKKGTMIIDGREDMNVEYKFSANLTNFDINELLEIVSYTQRIEEEGFVTEINYGDQPYNIAKDVEELKGEVYG